MLKLGETLPLERLAAGTVAGVARQVGDGLMFVMPKVRGHLGLQGALYNSLGQLLEQAVLANQVFGFLVASQQLVNQIQRWCFLCYGHVHSSLKLGSFPPNDRLHKNSYTTLA